MKTTATLTYRCVEDGEEQLFTVTSEADDTTGMTTVKMEFDPPCSDDTSDSTGLLSAAINAFKSLARRAEDYDAED